MNIDPNSITTYLHFEKTIDLAHARLVHILDKHGVGIIYILVNLIYKWPFVYQNQ